MQRRAEGVGILAEAILIGRVESPVFDRFEKLTQESLLDYPPDSDSSNNINAYVSLKDSMGIPMKVEDPE
ncbi:hypothetical protein ACTMTF_16070 [Nonomuraea sp. ZG12]|uniref:hypothetical protein n=1 Tax=Nonomuraea sp. ZG12 TaxID=3452207 RepID=UPI003F8AB1E6